MLQISVYYLYVRKTYEISNTLGILEKLMMQEDNLESTKMTR
jgi:hypothetical protein